MMHPIFGDAAAAPLPTLGLAMAAPAAAPLLAILVDAGRRALEAAVAGIRASGCRTRVDHTGPEKPTADGMRVARRVYRSGGDGPMPGKTGETIRSWVNDPDGRARERRRSLTAPASLRREAAMSSMVAVFGAPSGLAALLAGALFSGVFDGGLPKPARAGAAPALAGGGAPARRAAPGLCFHGPGGELLGFAPFGSAAPSGPRAAETDGGQRVFEVDGQTSGPTGPTCLVAEHR